MESLERIVNIDFDKLATEGELKKTFVYDDELEALRRYRKLYESLTLSQEMEIGEGGESFDFQLRITIHPPYVITVQIYLI